MRDMENHDFETAVERLKTRETVREMMNWMEQSFPNVVKALTLFYILKGFGSSI
jgi:short-subunit dehydrogenase involved in D-alanine esterification of teichoic acids